MIDITQPKSVEWNTPSYIVEPYRTLVGQIDFDPFSNERANKVIKALKFLTKSYGDKAFNLRWLVSGKPVNVWCNPPYGELLKYCILKIIKEWNAGHIKNIAILIRGDSKELKILQRIPGIIWVEFDDRIKFIDAKTGKPGNSPVPGSKLFYLGEDPLKFAELYQGLGIICCKYL